MDGTVGLSVGEWCGLTEDCAALQGTVLGLFMAREWCSEPSLFKYEEARTKRWKGTWPAGHSQLVAEAGLEPQVSAATQGCFPHRGSRAEEQWPLGPFSGEAAPKEAGPRA